MSKTNEKSNQLIPNNELFVLPPNENHNLSFFKCESPELNDFLKNDALIDQQNLVNRTNLCFWRDELTGFFSLVADTIETKNVADGIESYQYRKYPAIKIARLAVDSKYEKRGIGTYLVKVIMGQVISICDNIGCRYLLVDSKIESKGFYERFGFKIAERNKKKDFNPMYLNMQPIVAAIESFNQDNKD